jgi:hypothetical protein
MRHSSIEQMVRRGEIVCCKYVVRRYIPTHRRLNLHSWVGIYKAPQGYETGFTVFDGFGVVSTKAKLEGLAVIKSAHEKQSRDLI